MEMDLIDWKNNLLELEQYIVSNNELPSLHDDNTRNLAHWVKNQVKSLTEESVDISETDIIMKDLWRSFTSKHQTHFSSKKEIWQSMLFDMENYVITNNKLPSTVDPDPNIRIIAQWYVTQKKNYKEDKYIMKLDVSVKGITNIVTNVYFTSTKLLRLLKAYFSRLL